MKEYLPLGSVVLLNNGFKKVMIYGRKQRLQPQNTEYDYIACLYPEGNLRKEFTYLFNESDINEIVFRGFTDSDEYAYLQNLAKHEASKEQKPVEQ
jgi:hypothetical protein